MIKRKDSVIETIMDDFGKHNKFHQMKQIRQLKV